MIGAVPRVSSSVERLTRLALSQLKVLNSVHSIHTGATVNVRFKDVVPATKMSGSQDILLENMRSAKDCSDVLNAVSRHHSIMNSKHMVQALRSLFNLQRAHSSLMSNGEVVNSKDFRNLCEGLRSQIRHLELSELIDVLKFLGYLGVPANAKILNIILSLISKQVNDLSLQQITFLDFVMKDFKPTPLVKALQIALPIVFEANLQLRCDFDNVSQISDLLSFALRRKNMGNCGDILVEALTKKREELSAKDAKNIVFALCESKFYNENYQLLLCHALDVITDSLNKMDFYEMESILARLYVKHSESSGDLSCYHEEFCNGCIRLVIDRDYSFEQTMWILKKINKFNHTHLALLTHIAKKVEKEPWQLEQVGATGFITFLNGFAMADYKPPNWDLIKPLVLKACQGLMDRQELPWLRVCLSLCILDCWSEELLHKVFSREFLKSFMARDNKLDCLQLLLLDQVSATLSPWALRPRAPPDLITPIVPLNGRHITAFPLQAWLHQGLGGQQYVQTGVQTALGHFLDHVVVMRKGGYPVAINLTTSETKERINTEDIQVPPDSKMVAVLLVPSSMCATNNERVRGMFRITINSMEALGIAVAPILQPVWDTLPDFERIPYLMRAIQEKLPTTNMTAVVTPI